MRDTLAAVEARYEEIDRLLADPEISTDYTRIQSLAKEQASIRNLVTLTRQHRNLAEELADVRELLRDDPDPELAELAREELAELEGRMASTELELQMALLPTDPNDEKNVIMEIRAGTGGEEAGLFAAELYRMYTRYAQRNGWRIEVMDANETGLGAIKEIVFLVRGGSAFSRLKHESGTHRVQRIPVTESGGGYTRRRRLSRCCRRRRRSTWRCAPRTWTSTSSTPAATAGRTCRRWRPPCASPIGRRA